MNSVGKTESDKRGSLGIKDLLVRSKYTLYSFLNGEYFWAYVLPPTYTVLLGDISVILPLDCAIKLILFRVLFDFR